MYGGSNMEYQRYNWEMNSVIKLTFRLADHWSRGTLRITWEEM